VGATDSDDAPEEGTLYLFEVWDGKGRVKSERFRL
jgi:hypothetical protein